MKQIGHLKPRTPEESLRRAELLSREAWQLSGRQRQRGVYRFSTYKELETFRLEHAGRGTDGSR